MSEVPWFVVTASAIGRPKHPLKRELTSQKQRTRFVVTASAVGRLPGANTRVRPYNRENGGKMGVETRGGYRVSFWRGVLILTWFVGNATIDSRQVGRVIAAGRSMNDSAEESPHSTEHGAG